MRKPLSPATCSTTCAPPTGRPPASTVPATAPPRPTRMSATAGASLISTRVVASLQSGCVAVSVHPPGARPAISYRPSASVSDSSSPPSLPIRIAIIRPSPPACSALTVAPSTGRPERDSRTRPETTLPRERRTSTPSAASPSATVTPAALPLW